MFTSFRAKRSTALRDIYDSFDPKQKKIFETRSQEQKEIYVNLDLSQRIVYLAILEMQYANDKVTKLAGSGLRQLNDYYNDVKEKPTLKEFLGTAFPFLEQFVANARTSATQPEAPKRGKPLSRLTDGSKRTRLLFEGM